jgi:A/G-specific adenine glycosylase
VIRAWAGLGYNRRALNLQRTAQTVLADHAGRFPDTPETLLTLPGIGPYTAGAVACFAFERDVAFMDTNIRRVVRRLFVGPEGTEPATSDRSLLQIAETAIPPGNGYTWNQAIMELGALICTAARPRCAICPLQSECVAYNAWKQADEDVFIARAPAPRATRAVAERAAPYLASNRYFRGRLVAALRDLSPGETARLLDLGPRIKEDWTDTDLAWLQTVAAGLVADGLILIEQDATGSLIARLP